MRGNGWRRGALPPGLASYRLPPGLVARLDALAARLAQEAGGVERPSRSAALRLAVERGLAAMERELEAVCEGWQRQRSHRRQ